MKTFGYQVPVRNDAGEIVSYKPREVTMATKTPLGDNYGPDSGRAIVVSLRDGDIIALRPMGVTRKHEKTILVSDLYAHVIRLTAQKAWLEKARAKKSALAVKREARAIKRKERQLFKG